MVATEGSTSGGGYTELRNITRQVISGRWFTVFASLLIMAVSGATYMFGSYSNDIKTILGYDQTTLNLLSFFKDLGANLGVFSGLINEISPTWVILSMGAVMNFFGYFMIWLAVTGRVAKPQVWQMCLYICIGANSQTFANTGALVTCVKNFPGSRGSVLGLLKGYVGLSGAIITQLYHAFYGDDTKSLILLIAWIPAAVSIFFLPTLRILNTTRQPNELRVFYNLLYTSLGLAGFLMVLIIVQNNLSFTSTEYVIDGLMVLLFLFLPLAVVFREELSLWRAKKHDSTGTTSEVIVFTEAPPPMTEPPQSQIESSDTTTKSEKESSCFSNVFKPPNRGEDYTMLQALFSIDMLVLFTASTCSVGGTLTAIDNLGQIAKSLGYPSKSTSTFVSLVSIWNYLGRVVAGFASEILLTKYKFPRPLMLSLIMLLSCVGHVLIAFGVPNSLYFSSVIAGFCFGAQWPLIYAIISEIFGLKHYSTLLNFGGLSSPLGAYILNVKVTGSLYDIEASKQFEVNRLAGNAGELTCVGVRCFKMAFLIITASTMIGCFISLILVIRTRQFYQGDMYGNGKRGKESGTVSTETESLLERFHERS